MQPFARAPKARQNMKEEENRKREEKEGRSPRPGGTKSKRTASYMSISSPAGAGGGRGSVEATKAPPTPKQLARKNPGLYPPNPACSSMLDLFGAAAAAAA